jgi:glutathione S-transferase
VDGARGVEHEGEYGMMKLYVTLTSPYSRLARIVVAEKRLEDRVEIVEARTRAADSPYYRINPSGRVPYLVDDAGVGMEDSQLICAYLDGLDGTPWLHKPERAADLSYRRLEATARSMCDGIAVWVREMRRPEGERSPTVLAHEAARAQRLAEVFETEMQNALLQGQPTMAHLILVAGLEESRNRGPGDLTRDRPQLAAWLRRVADRPSIRATAPR